MGSSWLDQCINDNCIVNTKNHALFDQPSVKYPLQGLIVIFDSGLKENIITEMSMIAVAAGAEVLQSLLSLEELSFLSSVANNNNATVVFITNNTLTPWNKKIIESVSNDVSVVVLNTKSLADIIMSQSRGIIDQKLGVDVDCGAAPAESLADGDVDVGVESSSSNPSNRVSLDSTCTGAVDDTAPADGNEFDGDDDAKGKLEDDDAEDELNDVAEDHVPGSLIASLFTAKPSVIRFKPR